VIEYFGKALGAHFNSGRSLFLLTVLGVALGVASVLSIQIINRNALAAFEGSMHAVSGDADLSVLGRMPSLPESLYVDVLADSGVQSAWPLVRVQVGLHGQKDFFLEIIGVDFFAPVRVPWQGTRVDLAEALGHVGWAAFTPQLAAEMGWRSGDIVTVANGSQPVPLTVGALVDFQRLTPLASPKMVVMDIAQAQHLLGQKGRVQQIDVVVREGGDVGRVRDRLQARLGDAVQVLTPEQRTQQTEGLLSAFRLNLTALSLISLFVGLFLVYASTQASLVRRRAEFGMLRSIGATRGQVLAIILGEVVLLGGMGVIIGLPLGYWAAQANVDLVSATLSNLYLLDEISTLELPLSLFGLAGLIGIGGSLMGALIPALDTSRRDTRSLLSVFTLHEKMDSMAPRLGGLGLAVLALTGGWYAWSGYAWQHAGFVLAVGILSSLPLLTPLAIRVLTGWIPVRGFGLRYSLKSLGARLQNSAFAVAALAIAVSMLIGITLMVGSFRQTLQVWIGTTVQADIYVSPLAWRGQGDGGFLRPDLVDALSIFPGVQGVDRLRGFVAFSGEQRVALAGVDIALPEGMSRFALLAGDSKTAYREVDKSGAVLIGETLARRKNLWPGDRLPLYTPAGERSFAIAGVYYDYNAQGGAVAMDISTLTAHWGDAGFNALALYLEPEKDGEAMVDAIRATFPDAAISVRSNRRLREEAFAIFDQTFAITRLLQGISLLIAVCGIALMLLVLAREQVSELALYRALGATQRQIFGLFVGKGLGMGLLGLAMGAVGGVLLALILIFVINRAYFGWTIQLYWPWQAVTQQAITILMAAVVASLYPALKASKNPATELRRDDV
jgi:putative ABC transport system permease protein